MEDIICSSFGHSLLFLFLIFSEMVGIKMKDCIKIMENRLYDAVEWKFPTSLNE